MDTHDRLLILFMSEHGFVGGYNEVLLDHVVAKASGADLFVVGSRGLMLVDERGLAVAGSTPMATHQSGILKLARSLVAEIYRRISELGVRQVSIAYARAETAIASDVTVRTLLPLDLSHFTQDRSRIEPLHSLPAGVLTEKLAEEYVMAELAHVATEALASENGARLKTMDSAHENIDEKLNELRQREHQMRQEEITMELLDIVSGAEAMRTQ